MSSARAEFLEQQRKLLQLEHDEEKAQTTELLQTCRQVELSDAGVAILKLYLHNKELKLSTGLYGKTGATLTRYHPEDLLPAHRLSPGDIVGVFDTANPLHGVKPIVEAIVSKVRAKEIELVFSGKVDEDVFPLHVGPYHIAVIASDVTMSRYKYTLQDLEAQFALLGDFGKSGGGGSSSSAGERNKVVELCFASGDTNLSKQNSPSASSVNGGGAPGEVVFPRFLDDFPVQGMMQGCKQEDHDDDRVGVGPAATWTSFRCAPAHRLNEPQQQAVRNALRSQDLHVIHGPPGTGKTTTCVAFILECVARGMRLLVSAPSNVAVDNLLHKVAQHLPASCLVRIGHPVRVDADLQKLTLDGRVAGTEQAALCRDIEVEIKEHLAALRSKNNSGGSSKNKNAGGGSASTFANRRLRKEELSKLRKELKKRSTDAVKGVLASAQVVFCTCAGASEVKKRFLLRGGSRNDGRGAEPQQASSIDPSSLFDVVLVDEAAQTLEVACWIPLLCGRRAVLAGDHNQLAATVKSEEAARQGLDRTLFGRMIERFGDRVSSLLSIQYRMHDIIMGWSSAEFYDSRLEAAEEVRARTLLGTDGGGSNSSTDTGTITIAAQGGPATKSPSGYCFPSAHPLVFVDTVGNHRCREQEPENSTAGGQHQQQARPGKVKSILQQASSARCNPGEARILLGYAKWLQKTLAVRKPEEAKQTSICVITPYNQQVDHLRLLFAEAGLGNIPVNTVDSYQGREADVVLLSLVRSNENAEVGFLSDFRRLNVAVTRAKKHVLIVGNSTTICSDEVLASLYQYALQRGKVVFASETVSEMLDTVAVADAAKLTVEDGAECGPFEPEIASDGASLMANSAGASRKKKQALQLVAGMVEKDPQDGGRGRGEGTTSSEQVGTNANTKTSTGPAPMQMSAEEIEKRRKKFIATLEEFLMKHDDPDSARKEFHDFPKSLNARERLIVHEVCEKLGVQSESQGEGKKRFVRVFRSSDVGAAPSGPASVGDVKQGKEEAVPRAFSPEKRVAGEERDELPQDQSSVAADPVSLSQGAVPESAVVQTRAKLGAESPPASTHEKHETLSEQAEPASADAGSELLRDLARQREERQRRRMEEAEAARKLEKHQKLQAKKQQKEKKKQQQASGAKEEEEDDFDAILDDFTEKFPRGKCTVCKVSVKHLTEEFTTCEYCRRTFCFQHLQAELHGCGDAAKQKERAQRKHTLNPNKPKGPTDAPHRRAQVALQEKLRDAASERSKKPNKQ
ncbi:unnamed protein product [Amoebophrya sp. A120]|nr:unnamed protein product [Amoebophrya sp. A120]|eukprot:GSA120T00021629001.1